MMGYEYSSGTLARDSLASTPGRLFTNGMPYENFC